MRGFAKALCFCALVLFPRILTAGSAVADSWSLLFGTHGSETGNVIQPTRDGGYIIAGALAPLRNGDFSTVVTLLNAKHQVRWSTSFYSPYTLTNTITTGIPRSIVEVSDGFVVEGFTALTKLNRSGLVLWHKLLTRRYLTPVQQNAVGPFVARNAGIPTFSLYQLDTNGNLIWKKIYRLCGKSVWADFVVPAAAGGFFVGGVTTCGPSGHFIAKLSPEGNIDWWKIYSNDKFKHYLNLTGMVKTADGGLVIAGHIFSNRPTSQYAYWILKIRSSGELQWQRVYQQWGPISQFPNLMRLSQSSDGGFLAQSNENQITKLHSDGNVEWVRRFHAGNHSVFLDFQPTKDGGFVATGWAESRFGTGQADAWLLKVDNQGEADGACVTIRDQPIPQAIDLQVSVANVTAEPPRDGNQRLRPLRVFKGVDYQKIVGCD